MKPEVFLHAHHHGQPVELSRWNDIAHKALPHCKALLTTADAPLATLEEIEISLVSDAVIAAVHAQFLDDPSPTDVITFHHGEILISLDTAALQAGENQQPYEREVALYIIHGLLHLAGWNDLDPEERTAMHRHQETILSALWQQPDPTAS